MIRKFALVALLFGVGLCDDRPSEREFKLFCHILAETNDMLLEPDYVYDEDKDRNILREMQMLYNATTDNMKEFRKTLWVTKDFFEAHPPPTDAKNRQEAHQEIGKLIDEGEKKIQDSREIAVKVNEKIEEARLSVLQGLYGDGVKDVPKDEENLTKIQNDAKSIFEDNTSASKSCGKEGKAGKTLFNDLFCLCVGDANGAAGPCSAYLLSPKNNGGTTGSWTQMKYFSGRCPALSLADSIEKIMGECSKTKEDNLMKKSMSELLRDFEEMIGKVTKETNKKIFGHSGRGDKSKVTECDGSRGNHGSGNDDKNEKICVDYTKNINQDGKTYNIIWHKKFKNYTKIMQDAKKIEEGILKNRADLLLLKSQAWVAYSREKDDETSNLDDMNASDKKDTMAENKQGEPTNQEREYIDVPSQSTQGSQPSQLAPSAPDGRKYHYISSTESTQAEAPVAPAGGGEPPYIYVSSTGTPSQPTPAPETPSPTQQDPPTQPPKRLRDENKTGEWDETE